MTNERTDEQRFLIQDLERRVEELLAGLTDDSRSVLDRFEEGRRRIPGVERALRAALDAGVPRDDPTIGAVQRKGREVRESMHALEAESAAEREARDGPGVGTVLGRRAARLEADACERVLEILAAGRDAGEVLAGLEAVRDSTIRGMVAVGSERDFFQGGLTGEEFRRALAVGLEGRTAELRARLENEVLPGIEDARVGAVVESILGSSRFVERRGRSAEDEEHVARLGIGSGISDEARRRLAEAEALLDDYLAVLGDDSRSPADRVAAYPDVRSRLQEIMQQAIAEGLVLSQPAVMALRLKHQGVGARRAALQA